MLVPVVGAGVAGFNAWRGSRPPELSRDGSERVAPASAPAIEIERTPTSYKIEYAIELYRKDGVTKTSDEIEIRRPFDARIASEADGRRTDLRASRFGALVLTTGAGVRSLTAPPAPSASDLRVDPVLEEALASGALQQREQRRVLGRRCQVYRAGGTILSGELVAVGTKPAEYADFCVDAAGLVLEEVWVKDDRPLRRRVATVVKEDADIDDDRFRLADEEPFSTEQGGFMKEVDPASAFDGVVYRLESVPEGFEFVGRYVVQPPKLSPVARDPLAEEQNRGEQVSMVDVWTRGPELLTLYQTIAADIAAVPSKPKTSRAIELPVGRAVAILDLRVNEVRMELPEARFLRLMGTLPTKQLEEIAAGLRAEQGTGLRFL